MNPSFSSQSQFESAFNKIEMAKESKNKSPTPKASSNAQPSTLHPPYFQMINEAISSLKDRTGSSQPAIAKFIEEKYQNKLPPNFNKILSVQLKKFVKSEKLVKVKNSYKVSAPLAKVITKTKDVKTKPVAEIAPKKAAKVLEKAKKTKRLSQVKTPEALKKKSLARSVSEKVKNPEGVKQKKATVRAKKVKPMTPGTKKTKK